MKYTAIENGQKGNNVHLAININTAKEMECIIGQRKDRIS